MIYLNLYNVKTKANTAYIAYHEAENEYGNKEYLCFIEKRTRKN